MCTLVIAPHADDEVMGVGGTLARKIHDNEKVVVAIITGHGDSGPHPIWPKKYWETIRCEAREAANILGGYEIIFQELPASCLDHTPAWKINSVVSDVIAQVKPTEIYLPFIHDLHFDHGKIAYAGQVACRPYLAVGKTLQKILYYETLSETDLAPPYMYPSFSPNVHVDVSQFLPKKLEAMACYKSQLQSSNSPRSLSLIEAKARVRGAYIGVHSAEAFFCVHEAIR